MDLDFSIDLIVYALEKNMENDIFEMWKLQYPQMEKETFISFEDYLEDYKANYKVKKHTAKSVEEIEDEMLKVVKSYERR